LDILFEPGPDAFRLSDEAFAPASDVLTFRLDAVPFETDGVVAEIGSVVFAPVVALAVCDCTTGIATSRKTTNNMINIFVR